jgi:hypothetical protein
MQADIQSKIMTAHRAYLAHVKLFRSKLLARNTKLELYKTVIRPILTYGSETWTMIVEETKASRIFERKIVRKIYGPVKGGERWRIRTNKEVEDILQVKDTVEFIKSLRLGWFGHVERKKPKNYKTYCNTYNGRNKKKRKTT